MDSPVPKPDAPQAPPPSAPKRLAPRLLAAAAIAVVAAVAGTLLYLALRPKAVEVARAREGTVREEIHAPGTVQARVPVAISSRLTGAITRVLVDVGDHVTKRQLLVSLDDTDLRAKLESSKAAAAAATENVAAAEAALDKARADLELARLNHARSSELVKKQYVSQAEHDASTAALHVAEASEVNARKQIAARRAELARSEHEQSVAAAQLAYARIQAPMDGVVTRRLLEPGSVVVPSSPILQLVDPESLWVAALVDESLVGRVTVGQPAEIRLRSGARVKGTVARVTLQSDPVTRELEVDVAFDTHATRFSINEEAEVTIMGKPDRGLTVALAALTRRDGAQGVFVLRAGKAAFAPVRLGVSGRKDARVLEGLEPGEAVVLSPSRVEAGQRVRPVER